MVRRDGRIVWIHDFANMVYDAAGKARFWSGVMFDITTLKRAEEELARALGIEQEATARRTAHRAHRRTEGGARPREPPGQRCAPHPAGTRIWVQLAAGAFQRGPSTPSHAPGSGVGLTLVARFAELHGGRARVEEREGGGASFKVLLPG